MIESTRSQNVIVLTTILIGLVSGVYLISNTSYYSGSYAIAEYLTVGLEDVQIANLDPSNESVNPALLMIFNLKAPSSMNGQVTLTQLSAVVSLNQELIAYETFRKVVSLSDRSIRAGYNKNFTVGSTIFVLEDKQLLYNASLSGNWTFDISLTLTYSLFQSSTVSWRVLSFAYEGYTPT